MTTNLAVFLNLLFIIGRVLAIVLALIIGFNIWKQLKAIATELKRPTGRSLPQKRTKKTEPPILIRRKKHLENHFQVFLQESSFESLN